MEHQIRSLTLAELRGRRVPGVPIPMLPSEPAPEPKPRKKLAGNMSPGRDLTGCRFGALTVLRQAGAHVYTLCDCGTLSFKLRSDLLSNNTRACGTCGANGLQGGARKPLLTALPMKGNCFESDPQAEADHGSPEALPQPTVRVRTFPRERKRGRPPTKYLACQASAPGM